MDTIPSSGAEPARDADFVETWADQAGAFPSSGAEPAHDVTEGVPPVVAEVREMLAAPAPVALPPITSASVRVMRSHDYCHFEVVLGIQGAPMVVLGIQGAPISEGSVHRAELTIADIDATRKAAARLADKAVEQFKVAKENANDRLRNFENIKYARPTAEKIREIAEADRTPEQKAKLKAFDDAVFRWNREPYDYEDDWGHDDGSDGEEDSDIPY